MGRFRQFAWYLVRQHDDVPKQASQVKLDLHFGIENVFQHQGPKTDSVKKGHQITRSFLTEGSNYMKKFGFRQSADLFLIRQKLHAIE